MDKKHAKRTSRACDQCRRRKAKCDGRSLCGACQRLSLHCSYGDPAKLLRGPAYIALLENKVEQLEVQLKRYQSSNTDHSQQPGDDTGHMSDAHIKLDPMDEASLNDSGIDTSTSPCVSDMSPCQVELSAACATPNGDDIVLEDYDEKRNVNDSPIDSFALNPEVLSTMACEDSVFNAHIPTSTDVAEAWYQKLSFSDHSTGQGRNLDTSFTWRGAGMPTMPPLPPPPLDMSSDALHSDPPIDIISPVQQQLGLFDEPSLQHLMQDQQAEDTTTATSEENSMIQSYYESPSHQMTLCEILQIPPVEQSELKLKDLAPRHCNDEQVSSPDDNDDHPCGELQSRHRRSRSADARERNRLAAAKCRGKRKVAATQLERTAEEMESSNHSLRQEVRRLRDQRAQLHELVLDQKVGGLGTCDPVRIHHHCCDLEKLAGKEDSGQ